MSGNLRIKRLRDIASLFEDDGIVRQALIDAADALEQQQDELYRLRLINGSLSAHHPVSPCLSVAEGKG